MIVLLHSEAADLETEEGEGCLAEVARKQRGRSSTRNCFLGRQLLLPFMEMAGSCNRKRKAWEQDDDEDDEKKMEKFFALIRSIREARDFLMGGASNGIPAQKSKQEEEEKKKQPVGVWVPAFEMEDFLGEADRLVIVRKPSVTSRAAAEDKKEAEKEEGVGDEGLDLKLSL